LETASPATKITISLREIVARAFREKRGILAAIVIPPLVAIALLFFMTPIYRAHSLLLIKTGPSYVMPLMGTSNVQAPTMTQQEAINSEIEILTSRDTAQAVMAEIGADRLYPALATKKPWFGSAEDARLNRFSAALRVEPVKVSNIISLTFDHPDPALAIQVLSTLIRIYQDKHIAIYGSNSAKSYEDGLKRDAEDLAALEQERAAVKEKYQVSDLAQQRTALIGQKVDAENALVDAQTRQATLVTRIAYLQNAKLHTPNVQQSTETGRNEEMTHARDTLTDLKRDEGDLLARYSPDHPVVKQVQDQIKAVQAQIAALAANLTRVTTNPDPLANQIAQELVQDQAELAPLGDTIDSRKATITAIEQSLRRLEAADLSLRTLDAKITAANDNLRATRDRYEQARAFDDLEHAKAVSASVIQPPVAGSRPVKPQPVLYLAIGLLLGVAAGGAVVVLSVLLRKTFLTIEGVERALALPVLVAVPSVASPQRGA
jgi:uncharacterized protein involved in exopolysaccharide biosynthesis